MCFLPFLLSRHRGRHHNPTSTISKHKRFQLFYAIFSGAKYKTTPHSTHKSNSNKNYIFLSSIFLPAMFAFGRIFLCQLYLHQERILKPEIKMKERWEVFLEKCTIGLVFGDSVYCVLSCRTFFFFRNDLLSATNTVVVFYLLMPMVGRYNS